MTFDLSKLFGAGMFGAQAPGAAAIPGAGQGLPTDFTTQAPNTGLGQQGLLGDLQSWGGQTNGGMSNIDRLSSVGKSLQAQEQPQPAPMQLQPAQLARAAPMPVQFSQAPQVPQNGREELEEMRRQMMQKYQWGR